LMVLTVIKLAITAQQSCLILYSRRWCSFAMEEAVSGVWVHQQRYCDFVKSGFLRLLQSVPDWSTMLLRMAKVNDNRLWHENDWQWK
jgi:hypothetical protein